MSTPDQPIAPDLLALAALEHARPGMTIGLGTGRAAARFVRALAAKAARDSWSLTCVSTSDATTTLATSLGLRVVPPGEVDAIHLLVDGADEVDPELRMIKGGGAAMTRERIVASAAITSRGRCVYIVDDSKLSSRLGEKRRVPVEVLPLAAVHAERALISLGLTRAADRPDSVRRTTGESAVPIVTDNHAWVLDMGLPATIPGPLDALAAAIKAIPGVIDHGLFLTECHTLLIEDSSGRVTTRTGPGQVF
jgi:ribose 5-phosphate isomerase A